MTHSDRIKYDHVTGRSSNVTAEEEAIASFLSENSSDSSKVMTLNGDDHSIKISKRHEKNVVTVDDTGKPKIRISVFSGVRRHLDLGLKTDDEIKAEKKAAALEELWAERRARRAALMADSSED